ncbi:hypothetical protein GCM10010405_33360 [Streptomyces macrosporus]|uniref:Uncharacterized protein n=1 Tax=Streptomyces macrosporus TaxID=44032 RepID=A0ABN3K598_9ACTN
MNSRAREGRKGCRGGGHPPGRRLRSLGSHGSPGEDAGPPAAWEAVRTHRNARGRTTAPDGLPGGRRPGRSCAAVSGRGYRVVSSAVVSSGVVSFEGAFPGEASSK